MYPTMIVKQMLKLGSLTDESLIDDIDCTMLRHMMYTGMIINGE
jgi:hypothetical protein